MQVNLIAQILTIPPDKRRRPQVNYKVVLTTSSLTPSPDPLSSLLQISLLAEEVSRLTSIIMSLEESHAGQIQTLKDCLEAKHNQIVRLEAKVNQLSGSTPTPKTAAAVAVAVARTMDNGKDENQIR